VDYNTSIAGWSFALADALESYGYNARDVFASVGIDLSDVQSPCARLSVDQVQQVWSFAEQNTDDYFGVHASSFITPSSLHALGFGLWCSSSLKELFERYIRYRCVLSHMHFCELVDQGDTFSLNLIDERKVKSEITQDAVTSLFLRIARQLYGPNFSARSIYITRTTDSTSERLSEFFGAALQSEAEHYSLVVDADVIHKKLRFGNPALAQQQDSIVEKYIRQYGLISEYLLRVRSGIFEQLGQGSVSIEKIAEKLSVTVRTLQRRLAAENYSYNELLDSARKQLALEYAKDFSISVTTASLNLSFNDTSSFGRSFKRWTGSSFTDYRKSLTQ
jgi:AraC-like DNA-binding protein